MEKTIEALNYVRLNMLTGNQEEAYVTLVEIIDELTTQAIKKELASATQQN